MTWAVDSPNVLWGMLLLLLPVVNSGRQPLAQPYLAILPRDMLSLVVAVSLKLFAMLTIAALVLGIAGLHRTEQMRERVGKGAHIVLLLDRSSSMDNSFAGRSPTGAEEAKATAARRLLTDFVQQREHDLMGIVEYSTAPLYVMPLTENKQAVTAAIAATASPALAYTHVAKGLSMALSFFQQLPLTGSRIIVLVSDGAAAISRDDEAKLRSWFKQQQVRLYWIFLRTANSPGIYEQPTDPRDDNAQAMPELYLHRFFTSLGNAYQAYEAESPAALQQAIQDIDQLEHSPLIYQERLPRVDLSTHCYAVAATLLLLLFGLKFAEVRR